MFLYVTLLIPGGTYAIDQSLCESGKTVVLHQNGEVASCYLSNVYSTNGVVCNNGRATFYDNGSIESCLPSITATVDGVNCDQTGIIIFYPDGKLKSCKTAP